MQRRRGSAHGSARGRTQGWARRGVVLAVVATLSACSVRTSDTSDGSGPVPPEPVHPSAAPAGPEAPALPRVAPGQVALKGVVLEELARKARRAGSSCFAVARDGQLAGEWNWHTEADEPRQVFSVTKSITSALVGMAVKDGALDLDDEVARYVPQWRGTDSSTVTVRNLLANDSGREWSVESDYVQLIRARDRTQYAIGLDQAFEPGTTWAYNNAAIQVLGAVLEAATGQPVTDYARERLFEPLGMSHSRMVTDHSPTDGTQVFFGLETTCLDLLRFGQLYLDHGRSDGTQLLPRSFVRASVGRSSTDLNAAYGLLWWLNRPGVLRGATDEVGADGQPIHRVTGQMAPGAPADTFAALGLGGQVLLADPGSRTLVVRLSRDLDESGPYGFADAAEVITRAVR